MCVYVYTITQQPLRHRPQYETEWMYKFIKKTNNFGLPRILLLAFVIKRHYTHVSVAAVTSSTVG